MEATRIPKSEIDLFKPIDVHKEESELQHLIRTPSPVKKMLISMDRSESALPVCEVHVTYFDTGMKKPKEEKMMKDGKIHGIYKRWHMEGVLCEESNYTNGKLNGKQYYYSIHGRLTHEFNYKDGVMHGI